MRGKFRGANLLLNRIGPCRNRRSDAAYGPEDAKGVGGLARRGFPREGNARSTASIPAFGHMRDVCEGPIQQQKFLSEPANEFRTPRSGQLNPIMWNARKNVRTLAPNQFHQDQSSARLKHP